MPQNRHLEPLGDGRYDVYSEDYSHKFNDKPLSHKKALALLVKVEIAKHKASTKTLKKAKAAARSGAEVERRLSPAATLEARAADPAGPAIGVLSGYAIVFGARSMPMTLAGDSTTQFVEVVMPGALDKTLADSTYDVLALYGHDFNKPLGRRSEGTLKLTVDSIGLRATLALPDTTSGRDCWVEVGRRDIKGMSFGFQVAGGDTWTKTEDGLLLRELHEISLYEVSATSWPCYAATSLTRASYALALTRRRAIKSAREQLAAIDARGPQRPQVKTQEPPCNLDLFRKRLTLLESAC